jgi:hypothetical protein
VCRAQVLQLQKLCFAATVTRHVLVVAHAVVEDVRYRDRGAPLLGFVPAPENGDDAVWGHSSDASSCFAAAIARKWWAWVGRAWAGGGAAGSGTWARLGG